MIELPTRQPSAPDAPRIRFAKTGVPTRGDALTPDECQQAASIVSVGCDRATAARYLGILPYSLDAFMERNGQLDKDIARAEASAEIAHMRCVFNAAQDPKNYRAAIWWLERMRPELYNRRESLAVSDADLAAWTEQIVDAIASEVTDEVVRDRLLARLRAMIK